MKEMTRRAFLKVAGGAAAGGIAATAGLELPFIPAARAQGLRKVRFTLPWIPHGGYTHIFVAKKLGFWEKRGLDVSIDRGFGSGEVCKTLGLEKYEFGEIDIGVMINCIGKQMDLMALACFSPRSPVGIFSLKEKGIRRPKDLEGRRVAFTPGSGDFQLWPALVKAAGIDDGKVTKAFMGAEALLKAFISKEVDAAGNFYGSIAPTVWAHGQDLDMMLYDDYGVKMYSLAVASQGKRVRQEPEVCAKFVEGTMEGLAYTYLNPERSIDVHLEAVREYKGAPTGRDVVRHGQGIMTAMGIVPEVERNGLGWMDPEMVKVTVENVVRYMGLKEAPPLEKIYTNQFAGTIKLTPAQWRQVQQNVARYIPRKA
ncbi:MAG: ABC transporter substrate-binding protein [Deltaproteobacteria bacterium]|nr:ABC transporter substrate-binding protein [Deltaproteobacteria bacterium]